jgi:hypothetical protein
MLGHLHAGDWTDLVIRWRQAVVGSFDPRRRSFPVRELLDWLSHVAEAKPSGFIRIN